MTMQVNGTTGWTFADGSNQNTAATGFGFKNRIINGAMMIDQRKAGAALTLTAGAGGAYGVDRWCYYLQSGSGSYTAQQSTTAPTGFVNSNKITVVSTVTESGSLVNAQAQFVEGLNVGDLGWGAAGAQSVTISFWVQSSVTGTYSVSVNNDGYDYSYVANYTINVANTWEQKTITIAGPTAGTWLKTNGVGLRLWFDLGSGTGLNGTANTWTAAGKYRTAGSVQLLANSGATWYVTGVQLEKGSTATSFDYRPYGTELQLAQRYCRSVSSAPGLSGSTVNCQISIQHTGMRAAPSATATAALIVTNITSANYTQSSGSITIAENNADGGRYNLANFTGMTSGAAAYLISSGGTVLLTAEL